MDVAQNKIKRRYKGKRKRFVSKPGGCFDSILLQDEVANQSLQKKGIDQEEFGKGHQSKPTCEMDEKYLLGQKLTQWQYGDWDSLTEHTKESIASHPDRAKIALLIAAGHIQKNDTTTAHQFFRWARDWGCSEYQIQRILIAGIHNNLGRSAVISGQQPRAFKHFESAIMVGTPECEVGLVAHTRMNEQIRQINASECNFDNSRSEYRTRIINNEKACLSINKPIVGPDGKKRNCIVIAGMRHSGSTALFNILRLSLNKAGFNFISFYSEHKKAISEIDASRKIQLIKTHEFRDDIAFGNNLIITTRRDLRNTVASAFRRDFPLLRKLANPVEYAKYNRTLHDVWLPLSDYTFVYEEFIDDPIGTIQKLLAFIQLKKIDAAKIYEEVVDLPVDQYDITLLSPLHITDPDKKLSFSDTLSVETISKINSDHAFWLNQYGYI